VSGKTWLLETIKTRVADNFREDPSGADLNSRIVLALSHGDDRLPSAYLRMNCPDVVWQ
jgi:hypothetical protein